MIIRTSMQYACVKICSNSWNTQIHMPLVQQIHTLIPLPAIQAMNVLSLSQARTHTQTHTHSESHIVMAWNASYADWLRALSRSESSLEFDMRLKGAMSFQLGNSACQPSQLPLQPQIGKAIDFHSVSEHYLLNMCVSMYFFTCS